MLRKLKTQNFSLTCLAHRLIPWLVLSLIALGAGCGPQLSIQIDFQFPVDKKVAVQWIEVNPIIKSERGALQPPYCAQFNGKMLDAGQTGQTWVELRPGTRGRVDLSIIAMLVGDTCPRYAAQTRDSTWINVDADRLYVIGMTFTEQTACLPRSRDSAKNYQCH